MAGKQNLAMWLISIVGIGLLAYLWLKVPIGQSFLFAFFGTAIVFLLSKAFKVIK